MIGVFFIVIGSWLHTAILTVFILGVSCVGGTAVKDREVSDVQPDSVRTQTHPESHHHHECKTDQAPGSLSAFVFEWFGALAGLQFAVDRDAVGELADDPNGRYIGEHIGSLECSAKILSLFAEKGDPEIRLLAQEAIAALNEAIVMERQRVEQFRSIKWDAYTDPALKARHWEEIRASSPTLSSRMAEATYRVAARLREDSLGQLGSGRLRISDDERLSILRVYKRFCDPNLLRRYRVQPDRPMSAAACEVLTWLNENKGLSYR